MSSMRQDAYTSVVVVHGRVFLVLCVTARGVGHAR